MPARNGERLEHQAGFDTEVNHVNDRADTIDKLWDNSQSLTKQEMDVVMFGQQRDGESDDTVARWSKLDDGMSKDKMDDQSLSEFARDTAEHYKEVKRDILNDPDVTREYLYRDDLLVERVDSIETDLLSHTLLTVAERSQWFPLPGDHGSNIHNYSSLITMARKDQWEDIPARIREMHQEAQSQPD